VNKMAKNKTKTEKTEKTKQVSGKDVTKVLDSELTITAVERVGDLVKYHVTGSLTIQPAKAEREQFVGKSVGSRVEVKKFEL